VFDLTVNPLIAALGFIAVILYVAYWAYRLENGVPFRAWTSIVGSAVCVGLFVLVEGGSWSSFGVIAALGLVLLGLAVVIAAVYTYDSTRLLRYPNGRVGCRTRPGIPLAWFLLLSLTLASELVLLGSIDLLGVATIQVFPNPLEGLQAGLAVPGAYALGLVNILFALSTGLVLGENVGVWSKYAHGRWVQRSVPRPTRAGG